MSYSVGFKKYKSLHNVSTNQNTIITDLYSAKARCTVCDISANTTSHMTRAGLQQTQRSGEQAGLIAVVSVSKHHTGYEMNTAAPAHCPLHSPIPPRTSNMMIRQQLIYIKYIRYTVARQTDTCHTCTGSVKLVTCTASQRSTSSHSQLPSLFIMFLLNTLLHIFTLLLGAKENTERIFGPALINMHSSTRVLTITDDVQK